MSFSSKENFNGALKHINSESSQEKWQNSQLDEANSYAESECLNHMWLNNDHDKSLEENYCSAVWDNAYCWPPTAPGILIKRACSEIFNETYPQYAAYITGYANRECLMNGTWAKGNESNYDECAESFASYLKESEEKESLVPMVHHMLFYGSILSLICLGISLGIFYHFTCLRSDRVTVHAQLMLSLVLRFVLMFIITEPYVIGHESSYRDVEILCESILVLFLYATFASVSWMFIQGLYLNIALMAGAFTKAARYQLTIYYIIGWGVPGAFVFAYVITMLFKNQESCWNGYSKMKEMWILLGPIMFELVINGIFLINILRVLLRKIRNSRNRQETSQLKAAAKATAILFPVLGINNLILLYNPGGNYNKYFVTLNTFFGSTQGIFVAIVYCFADHEVLAAVRRSLERANARRLGNPNRITYNLDSRLHTFMKMFSSRQNNTCETMSMEHAV